MHSSRMRTARSTWGVYLSVCWNTPPGCGPGDPPGVDMETPRCGHGDPHCDPGEPPLWAWRPPGVGLETPPGVGLETPPPRCRHGDPPRSDPSSSPLGVSRETCKACWDTTQVETCKACRDTTPPPSMDRQTRVKT